MADPTCTCEACATLRAWGEARASLRGDGDVRGDGDDQWRMRDIDAAEADARALADRLAAMPEPRWCVCGNELPDGADICVDCAYARDELRARKPIDAIRRDATPKEIEKWETFDRSRRGGEGER